MKSDKSDEKWWKVMKSDEKWWKVMKSNEKWWKGMKSGELLFALPQFSLDYLLANLCHIFFVPFATILRLQSPCRAKCAEAQKRAWTPISAITLWEENPMRNSDAHLCVHISLRRIVAGLL